MSLMSDLGTAVGLEFKNQRDLIKNLETHTSIFLGTDTGNNDMGGSGASGYVRIKLIS